MRPWTTIITPRIKKTIQKTKQIQQLNTRSITKYFTKNQTKVQQNDDPSE